MPTRKPFLITEELAELLGLEMRQAQRLIKTLPGAQRIGRGSRSPFIVPIESAEAFAAQRKQAQQKRARGQKPRAR